MAHTASHHVKYLIVGGGVAASAAVGAIRERDREGSVLLACQEVIRPYHRPPLSGAYLLGQKTRRDLFTLPDDWMAQHQVELQTASRANHLDRTRRTVTFDNGHEVTFDRMLIATGGSSKPLKIPGGDLPNVYYLRTITDADRLHNAIEKALREGRTHAGGRGRAAIVGAGLLSVELASTFAKLHLGVDLLLPTAYPWDKFAGEATGRLVMHYLQSQGVSVHPVSVPVRLEGDGRVQRVILPDRQTIDCDFVVPAMGAAPNKSLLRGTSLASEKAILVNDHCQTSDPDIFAAGDCAAIHDPLFDKYRVMEHWQAAVDSGALAGRNMAGADEAYSEVNSFTSHVLELGLWVWGESRVVERRIIRGNLNIDGPDFVEIGVDGEGRIGQVVAVGHERDHEVLRELVRRRVNVVDKEAMVRDPQVDLGGLL